MSRASESTLAWSSVRGPHIFFSLSTYCEGVSAIAVTPSQKQAPMPRIFMLGPNPVSPPMTHWYAYGSFGHSGDLCRHWVACSVERYSMITHVQVYSCRKPELCHASPLLRPPCWDRLQSSLQNPEAQVTLTAISDAKTSSCGGYLLTHSSCTKVWLQGQARL